MNKAFAVSAIVLLCLSGMAQADVFNLGPGLTNLETVTVGDPGNAPDTNVMNDGTTGYGSVSYTYKIGEYEVTTAQYCDFLNHTAKSDFDGLYNTNMANTSIACGCNIQRSGTNGSYVYTIGSGSASDITNWGNRPVNYVNYWDSCRFANWLTNGQGSGSTELGAYTLRGYTGPDGRNIVRNAVDGWFVPTENEWYKAAYYKGGGKNAGYWMYPTQSNTAPGNQVINPDPGNEANYSGMGFAPTGFTIGPPYYRSNVGEFENSASAYGTFDQGGNVFEWNESVASVVGFSAIRDSRGGSWDQNSYLQATARYTSGVYPTSGDSESGFRLVFIPNLPPS